MQSERKNVLLVDDDPGFLRTAETFFQEASAGALVIHNAPSGGEAMAFLQSHPVDLIVLDVNMPVLDGAQLVGLLQRRFPAVIKAVLTGEATREQRAACLAAGAELILDKPSAKDGWKSALAALQSLLLAPKEEGFRGVLRKVSLPDVIQMECLAVNSSILEVTGAGLRGRLYIKEGQIIHADVGELTGVEALNNIMCLPGGSFQLHPYTDPGRETISGQWEFLLMEAARARDEIQQANPGAAPTEELLPDHAAIEAFSIQPPFAKPPAEVSATRETETPNSVAPASPEPPTQTSLDTSVHTITGMQPVVKETLICSLQGAVLYDWNCPNTKERIGLLEFVTRRAASMAAALPLGGFERFEFVEKGSRCVAKLEGDRALLVRVQFILPHPPDTTATL